MINADSVIFNNGLNAESYNAALEQRIAMNAQTRPSILISTISGDPGYNSEYTVVNISDATAKYGANRIYFQNNILKVQPGTNLAFVIITEHFDTSDASQKTNLYHQLYYYATSEFDTPIVYEASRSSQPLVFTTETGTGITVTYTIYTLTPGSSIFGYSLYETTNVTSSLLTRVTGRRNVITCLSI